jgi:PKD repeat protein
MNMKHIILSRQLFILLLCGTFLFGCKREDSYYVAPKVRNLDFVTPYPLAGVPLSFRANTHDGTVLFWDFGDGSTQDWTNSIYGTHTYKASGTYIVKVTADHDTASTKRDTIKVVPNYRFTYDGAEVAGGTVAFHFPAFMPAANTYKWTFGDGTTSTDSIPTHIYTASGVYNVNVIANEDKNASITKTIIIYQTPNFMKLISNARNWTNGTQQIDNGAVTSLKDTTFQMTYIDPKTISWGPAVLDYSPTLSSGNIVVFTLGVDGYSLYKTVVYDIAADTGRIYSKTVYSPKAGVTHTTIISYHTQ